MTYVYYLTSRIKSWPQKTKQKQKSKPIHPQLTEDHFTVCQQWGYTFSERRKPVLCPPQISFILPLPSFFVHLALFCLCPVDWVGRWKPRRGVLGALSTSQLFLSCLSFMLQSFSLLCFYQDHEWLPLSSLLECPVGGMLCKKIIVLHNCPVLRDARSHLAVEQTLLFSKSYESRTQCVWEVALSSALVPQRWPLPQLW